jgi:hypothetical protein
VITEKQLYQSCLDGHGCSTPSKCRETNRCWLLWEETGAHRPPPELREATEKDPPLGRMPMATHDLTWTCHVCGEVRPDNKIMVFSKVKKFGNAEITQNVRYCIDKPDCIEGARNIDWLTRTEITPEVSAEPVEKRQHPLGLGWLWKIAGRS